MQVQNPLEYDRIMERTLLRRKIMEKQTIAVLGAWFLGNCPFTSLKWQWTRGNGIWGKSALSKSVKLIPYHTNKLYFKDVVLDKNIIAYTDLAEAEAAHEKRTTLAVPSWVT